MRVQRLAHLARRGIQARGAREHEEQRIRRRVLTRGFNVFRHRRIAIGALVRRRVVRKERYAVSAVDHLPDVVDQLENRSAASAILLRPLPEFTLEQSRAIAIGARAVKEIIDTGLLFLGDLQADEDAHARFGLMACRIADEVRDLLAAWDVCEQDHSARMSQLVEPSNRRTALRLHARTRSRRLSKGRWRLA